MYANERDGIPHWFWGVLAAIGLIGVTIWFDPGPGNQRLSAQFAAQPTPNLPQLPALSIGQLPPDLQAAAQELWQQLANGAAVRPLEPTVRGTNIEVTINQVIREGEQARVIGVVTNRGSQPLVIPLSAFELRDSLGISYRSSDPITVTLEAGASTPLELSLPLPLGRGVLLITDIPPEAPLQQILIAEVPQ